MSSMVPEVLSGWASVPSEFTLAVPDKLVPLIMAEVTFSADILIFMSETTLRN